MIAVLKYNAGNASSVVNAIQKLGFETTITDDKSVLRKADKVIFPGVGEANSAMQYLKEKQLDVILKQLEQPVLGICLGMQLLCQSSEEGNTQGLGIFPTTVHKFPPLDIVPHIGWNTITDMQSQLFENLDLEVDCYYVHSYYAKICEATIAITNYLLQFSAALHKNNFYATQFHPEKSGTKGSLILQNFLNL